MDFMQTQSILDNIGVLIIAYIGKLFFTIVGFYLLFKILTFLNKKVIGRYINKVNPKRTQTIVSMINNLIKYVMLVIGSFAILVALGFDAKVLIASAGVFTVVIGFAAKELIADFINGFFIIVEGYYDVGDYIKVNGYEGEVLKLGIKSTELKTYAQERVTIPNSMVEQVENLSKDNLIIFKDVPSPYESDVQDVQKIIINEIIPQVSLIEQIIEVKYLGVDMLADSSINHKLKLVCQNKDKFIVDRQTNFIIKTIYDQYEIEIPYNKITMYKGDV